MKKVIIAAVAAVVLIAGGLFGYKAYMDSYKGGEYCLINEKGEKVSDIRISNAALLYDGDFGGALVVLSNRWPEGDSRYKEAYAVLDANGKIVLGPSEQRIDYLKQGLFSLGRDIYDATGTKVGTAEKPGIIGRFGQNGLATLETGAVPTFFGYIDTTGSYVIEPDFRDGGVFGDNGLAAVKNDEDLWGYINESGNYVIEPQFEYAGMFSDGLAPVMFSEGNWAYIRENGETAFEVNCKYAEEFSNGCAVIKKANDKTYVINTDGDRINQEEYDNYPEFYTSDIACVETEKGYGFIKTDGSPVFDKIFKNAGDFSSMGLCAARDENGLWGYIGTDGEWVIAPSFEQAYPFDSKGKVAVVKPAK